MRKLIILIALAVGSYLAFTQQPSPGFVEPATSTAAPESFSRAADQSVVTGVGEVSKVLSDDNEGSRHQRFILRLRSGQTVLIAHNIDLAPRVTPLLAGDTVNFKGEYVWSEKGGTIHWTHHDPAGQHQGGWLKHAGQTYQ